MKRISDFVNNKDCRTISLCRYSSCKRISEKSGFKNRMSNLSIFANYIPIDEEISDEISFQRGGDIFYKYDKMIDARFNISSTMSSMRPIDNNFTQVAKSCDYRNDVEVTL